MTETTFNANLRLEEEAKNQMRQVLINWLDQYLKDGTPLSEVGRLIQEYENIVTNLSIESFRLGRKCNIIEGVTVVIGGKIESPSKESPKEG